VDDAWLTSLAGLALAVHLGALPFVWGGRRPRLLALVNLSIALPALWVLLDRPRLVAAPVDWPVLGFAAFEMWPPSRPSPSRPSGGGWPGSAAPCSARTS
jgi:hypothetical protein